MAKTYVDACYKNIKTLKWLCQKEQQQHLDKFGLTFYSIIPNHINIFKL